MTLETIVRILKEKDNCYVSSETLNRYTKNEIEKECGFEIRVRFAYTCEKGYILERVY